MKVVGTVVVINRLAHSVGCGANSKLGKACKGVLQVRSKGDGKYNLIVSTNKEIEAYNFNVRQIQGLRTKLVHQGFATIEISQPPYDIMVRNCNPEEIQVFINDLKKFVDESSKKVCTSRKESVGSSTSGASLLLRSKERGAEILTNSSKGKESDETIKESTKPGTLRKCVPKKRPRSPELSKTEACRIKKMLRSSDRVISVKDRADYPAGISAKFEEISMCDIGLRKVDERILKLQNLNYLDLSGNKLERVDTLANLRSQLSFLNLSKNSIRSLPDDYFLRPPFQKLLHLNLSENKLEKIPSSVTTMHELTNVNLSGNKLRYLPYNWMDMHKLWILNVSNNQLLFMPVTVFRLKLASLDMSENSSLYDATDTQPDYVGYSSVPSLFETSCEVVMNTLRRKRLQPDENLPAVTQSYLRGGKYCLDCGKLTLRYKILKDCSLPALYSSDSRSGCDLSPARTRCVMKKIICYACDNNDVPRIRRSVSIKVTSRE